MKTTSYHTCDGTLVSLTADPLFRLIAMTITDLDGYVTVSVHTLEEFQEIMRKMAAG